jgi:hypothetical protein
MPICVLGVDGLDPLEGHEHGTCWNSMVSGRDSQLPIMAYFYAMYLFIYLLVMAAFLPTTTMAEYAYICTHDLFVA